MAATPADGLARLRAAAESGALDSLGARYGIRVLTVFGSAARAEPTARDLDIAVAVEPGSDLDVLGLLDALVELTGVDAVDLAHLDRGGPLLKERALVGCVPLFESVEGAYASAQMAAIGERVETDALRRLDLDLLAG